MTHLAGVDCCLLSRLNGVAPALPVQQSLTLLQGHNGLLKALQRLVVIHSAWHIRRHKQLLFQRPVVLKIAHSSVVPSCGSSVPIVLLLAVDRSLINMGLHTLANSHLVHIHTLKALHRIPRASNKGWAVP